MKTKTLYLIRHTPPQIEPGICYGQLDVDITPQFAEQAAVVNNWLPPVELVINSPLQRTRKLAEYLVQLRNCTVLHDARLMEMHFGEWEGCAWSEIARSEINAWSADVAGYTPPGGESAQKLMQRVKHFLQDLASLPQQHIALVAHGGSLRAVLAHLAEIPVSKTLNWQIEYGAVIVAPYTVA